MTALAPVIRVGNKTPIKTVIRTKGYKTEKKERKTKTEGKHFIARQQKQIRKYNAKLTKLVCK